MACPMPLVDPVTSAVLPLRLCPIPTPCLSLFDLLAPRRRGIGRAQHLHVLDAILVVRRGDGLEPEAAVEALEVLLCSDSNRLPGPEALGPRDGFAHEVHPGPRAASRGGGEHAADGSLLVLHARRDEPRIRVHRAIVAAAD